MHDESGPPELEWFPCGHCRQPVATYWAAGHRGLLRGDYDLLGDVIFHRKCTDKYVEEFEKDASNAR